MNDQSLKPFKKSNWWWIRHAPTGIKGRMVGRTDVAAVLPDRVYLEKVASILPCDADWLVSPLARCQQTTEALLDAINLSPRNKRILPEFQEQDFGDWENCSYDDPSIRNAREFWDAPATCVPPGGESFENLMSRVHNEINAQPECENIIVIAHAGVIRAAIALALNLNSDQALQLQIDPLSLTRLEKYGNIWSVNCTNQS